MGRPSRETLRRWAWYAGVLLAAVLTVLSFLSRSLVLTVELVVLVWVLRRYSGAVRIARVYRERGIDDELLGGGRPDATTDR